MTETLNWLTSELSPRSPGFWLAVDVVVGIVLWLWTPHATTRMAVWMRVGRWLLIPWTALMVGALSPQSMGLTHNSWQTALTTGVGIVLTFFVLVAAARYALRATDDTDDAKAEAKGVLLLPQPHSPYLPIYSALYHGVEQFHWCFQRAVIGVLVASAPFAPDAAAYWALWLATLLALPGILTYRAGSTRMYTLVALLSTSILFFYTHNFWLCWVLHAGIMILAGSVHLRPDLQRLTSSQ